LIDELSNRKFGSLCYGLNWVSFSFFICNVFVHFFLPLSSRSMWYIF